MTICAIIVTYNRLPLLKRCLQAMLDQTARPERILVIDNASSDGTEAFMRAQSGTPQLDYVRMPSNEGGSKGFAEGLRRAYEGGFRWAWIMDDDAFPHPDALEALASKAVDESNIYGSLAVNGDHAAWPLTLIDERPPRDVFMARDVPETAAVRFLPFLGILIPTSMVPKIGLPDAGFFIAADDVEYCLRARGQGAKALVVGKSRVEHPRADIYYAKLPGRTLTCLRIAPWKRYYDTRNRLLVAKAHHGLSLYTETLPGTFVRWLACMLHEKQRLRNSWAMLAGTVDGLLGRKGARHLTWRIKP
jgi:rhamnopyranosyl-N-acetylglucosaminyl-diphospho-decaprenol beta-1,3/1,4-galactofuranosyltransferase